MEPLEKELFTAEVHVYSFVTESLIRPYFVVIQSFRSLDELEDYFTSLKIVKYIGFFFTL